MKRSIRSHKRCGKKRETDQGRGEASVKSGFGCREGPRGAEAVDFYHANGAAETNGSSHQKKRTSGRSPAPLSDTYFKTLRPTKGSRRSHVFGPKVETRV